MPPSFHTLPHELVSEVLSYLEAEKSQNVENVNIKTNIHPFFAVAATSKSLNQHVEAHCRHYLTKVGCSPRVIKRTAKSSQFRKKWVHWVNYHCRFCGKKTERPSIMDKNIVCCMKCDKIQWPKITMTEALNTTMLTKLDLFTPNILHPDLPPLRASTYKCMGAPTTVILTEDVKAREAYVAKYTRIAGNKAAIGRRRRRLLQAMELMDEQLVGGKWVKRTHGIINLFDDLDISPEAIQGYVKDILEPDWQMKERLKQMEEAEKTVETEKEEESHEVEKVE
jgi:hypothetical protein